MQAWILALHPGPRNQVPAGPDWVHEIKQEGWLIVVREDKRVRLFSRNGHDWSGRFPLITEAALRIRSSSGDLGAVFD